MFITPLLALMAAITLTSTDGQGKTSFTDGARWSDEAPPSPENEYVVAGGLDIRSPAQSGSYSTSTNAAFAGNSLTLGDASKGGHLILKTTCSSRGVAKVTVGDLVLANSGSYIEHGGNSTYTELDGKITFTVNQSSVTGTSVPYFQSSDTRYLDVSAQLVSAAGKGFKVILAPNKTTPFHLALTRDNPEYLGYMAAGNDGIYLTAESAGALGPNPASPTALLNLRNGGAFGVEYASDEVVIDQPNRGIYVSSNGGGRFYAAKGRTLTTSMFVSSGATPSPVEKIGEGNFFLSGAYGAGDITVSGGWLGLAGDVSRTVTIANNCYFGPATRTSTLSLSGSVTFVGSASAFRFRYDPSDLQNGVIELKDGFTSSVWPIPFVMEGSLPVSTCTQTLFRVASSVRRVSNADFTCRNAPKTGYNRLIEVVTDADGWQTVRQVQSPQVRMKAEIKGTTDDARHRFLEADPWEDDKAPSAEKDYLVGTNQTIRTSAATPAAVTFPGHQLKLEGTADFSGPATLMLKAKETTVPHLMLKNKSVLNAASYSGNGDHLEQVLNGTIDLADAYAYIYASYDRLVTVNAALAGNGVLHLCPNVRNESVTYKNQMRVSLTGDNSAYRGSFLLTGQSTSGNKTDNGDEGVTPVELIITDEKNVGGNPDAYSEDALRLSARCMLTAAESLTLQNPNRPVKVVNFASVKVADGKTLTLSSPLILHGILTKVGGGTLAVARLDPGSKTKAIELVEGCLMAASTNGFDGVTVTVSKGAAVRIDADTDDDDLSAYGFYDVANELPLVSSDGARIRFDVDDPKGRLAVASPAATRVAVLTVSAVAANLLAGQLCVRRVQDGRRLVLERGEPDSEGRVTFFATPHGSGLMLIVK